MVTTIPGTGTSPVIAGRTTRPSTVDAGDAPVLDARSWACSGATAASTRARSAQPSLRIELPEVFGAEVLKVGLELIGGELGRIGLAGLRLLGVLADARCLVAVLLLLGRLDHELVGGVDRRGEPQGDGDAVGRARVDVHERLTALDLKLGVVSALLDARDVDTLELGAHPDDQVAHEI